MASTNVSARPTGNCSLPIASLLCWLAFLAAHSLFIFANLSWKPAVDRDTQQYLTALRDEANSLPSRAEHRIAAKLVSPDALAWDEDAMSRVVPTATLTYLRSRSGVTYDFFSDHMEELIRLSPRAFAKEPEDAAKRLTDVLDQLRLSGETARSNRIFSLAYGSTWTCVVAWWASLFVWGATRSHAPSQRRAWLGGAVFCGSAIFGVTVVFICDFLFFPLYLELPSLAVAASALGSIVAWGVLWSVTIPRTERWRRFLSWTIMTIAIAGGGILTLTGLPSIFEGIEGLTRDCVDKAHGDQNTEEDAIRAEVALILMPRGRGTTWLMTNAESGRIAPILTGECPPSWSIFLLGELRHREAIPALAAIMRCDRRKNHHYSAAVALARMGSEDAISFLVADLYDAEELYGNPGKVEVALRRINGMTVAAPPGAELKGAAGVLSSIGPRAVKPLRPLLQDSKVSVRHFAVKVLAAIGEKATVEALSEALSDQDDLVRCRAAEALGKVGDKKAIPALEAAVARNPSDRILAAKVGTAVRRLALTP